MAYIKYTRRGLGHKRALFAMLQILQEQEGTNEMASTLNMERRNVQGKITLAEGSMAFHAGEGPFCTSHLHNASLPSMYLKITLSN